MSWVGGSGSKRRPSNTGRVAAEVAARGPNPVPQKGPPAGQTEIEVLERRLAALKGRKRARVKQGKRREAADARNAAVDAKVSAFEAQRAQILASLKPDTAAADRAALLAGSRVVVKGIEAVRRAMKPTVDGTPVSEGGIPIMWGDPPRPLIIPCRTLTISYGRVAADGTEIDEWAIDWTWRGKSASVAPDERREIGGRGGATALAALAELFCAAPGKAAGVKSPPKRAKKAAETTAGKLARLKREIAELS